MKTSPQYVSVIIPAYNAEKVLSQAVESVLAQTHTYFELLLIDDLSSDCTRKIMEEYAEQDERIRVLYNARNAGVSETRNRGVREAHYPWIALLDSDDRWAPDKLEKQLAVMETCPEISVCFTASAFMQEDGRLSDHILHVPQRVTYKELLNQNIISCSSVLVRREAMLRHPMYADPLIHEDFAAWLQILQETPYAVGVDEPLLIYRISAGSKSGNKLRAAKMQWNTYRYMKIPLFTRCLCFIRYALRNVLKYRNIFQKMQ